MERPPHVQKPHSSTTNLLSWSSIPSAGSPLVGTGHAFHSGTRSHQPSNDMRKALSGGQTIGTDAENLRDEHIEGQEIHHIPKADNEKLSSVEEKLEIMQGDLKGLKEDMCMVKEQLLSLENMLKKLVHLP